MNDFARAWWALARSAGEIAWLAPQVMQQRTARMLQSSGRPRARDQREAVRMVTEKWEAGAAAQAALWRGALQLQQRLAAELWAGALGLTPRRAGGQRTARRAWTDAAVLARQSLAPVRQRVRGNARRLRRRS
jgi:hypothetical protein